MLGKWKVKHTLKKAILLIVVIVLLLIVILERLSRLPCANIYTNYKSPCYDLVKKYIEPQIGYFPLSFPEEKIVPYSDINNTEFRHKAIDRTTYVPASEVRANGIACGMYSFVSEDLPERAKLYVSYHENIHIEGDRNEARTNYLAARLEPIGFIQTVFYSIWVSVKKLNVTEFPCQIGRLWFVFKIYFINIQ